MKICSIAFFVCLSIYTSLHADTVMVDTTTDVLDGTVTNIATLKANKGADGKISFREALIAANNEATPGHSITYDVTVFSPTAQAPIEPATSFPQVTNDGVTFDGTSAGITLDGSTAGGDGLVFAADGILLQGHTLADWSDDALHISSGYAQIGGTTAAQGNIIISSGDDGIDFSSSDDGSVIQGNSIGTNLSFENRRNIDDGIYVNGTGSLTIGGTAAGAGNIIAWHNVASDVGISVANGSPVIQGNRIGTNAAGADLGNTIGILLQSGADNVQIGGTTAGAGNTIGFSVSYQIQIETTSGTQQILGNTVGTDSTNADFGGSSHGIYVNGAGSTLTIGGTTAAAANVIAFHDTAGMAGIYINDGGPTILGNHIGVSTGGADIGNHDGIVVAAGADTVVIGGTASGSRNRIGHNDGVGVDISQTSGSTTIQGNALGGDGTSTWPNGEAVLQIGHPLSTVNLGNAAESQSNILVAGPGQMAILMSNGTVDLGGTVDVDGNLDLNNGTFDMNSGSLVVTGDIDPSGATFMIGTDSTITLDGANVQTLTGITAFQNLHYAGSSFLATGTWSIDDRLIVESGVVTVPGTTLTFSAGARLQIGQGVGSGAIISLDGATLTSTTPGTDRWEFSVEAGGDMTAKQNCVFDSIADTGLVMKTGSRLASSTTYIENTDQFTHVTFDNISATGIGLDLSDLQASDGNSFPRLLLEIRFNGNAAGTNVRAGATTPETYFGVMTGDFGTLAANGVGGETDPSSVVFWMTGITVNTVSDTLDGTVTSVANLIAGPGADGNISLREALTAINADSGTFIVAFDEAVFPATITVTGSALPTLKQDRTHIRGFNTGVTLDGTGLGAGIDGISVDATACDIRGVWITNFPDVGVSIQGGSLTLGSQETQDYVIIGGNGSHDIEYLSSSASTTIIAGCWIGTNRSYADLGSTGHGIHVNGTGSLTIGGTQANAENHIAFHDTNDQAGIYVTNGAPTIIGNMIGTNAAGTDLGNHDGIRLAAGADGAAIGGTNAGEGNVIGHSDGSQIVYESTTGGQIIRGNFIGTDSSNRDLGGGEHGLYINSTAGTGPVVGGTAAAGINTIAFADAAGMAGIYINDGALTSQRNRIGTNASGTDLGNANGIVLATGADTTSIGGTANNQRNTIGHSDERHIHVLATSGTHQIFGNYIGTDASDRDLGTTGPAIEIDNGGGVVTIGSTSAGGGNWIAFADSANQAGILVTNGRANIFGNFIGTDAAGNDLGNAVGIRLAAGADTVVVGGTGASDGNTIGHNDEDSVLVEATSGLHTFYGNSIGTDASNRDLGNGGHGIHLNAAGATILIGGSSAGQGNTICFHDVAGKAGLQISDGAATIRGNSIGTNGSGGRLGNDVGISLAAGADAVVIGGLAAGEGNAIGGNNNSGISTSSTYSAGGGVLIRGNLVGCSLDGTIIAGANGAEALVINAGSGVITLGDGSETVNNRLVASSGSTSIRQDAGTLNIAGSLTCDGALDFNAGSVLLGSSVVQVTGDIDVTGGTMIAGTSTITCDGSSIQTLTAVSADTLYLENAAGIVLASSGRFSSALHVNSGVVTAGSITLTFSDASLWNIGSAAGSPAVVSLDTVVTTSTAPGTHRWSCRINPGGDLFAKQGSRFDSLSDAGLVVTTGGGLGSGTGGGFSSVTFDNVSATGIALDLSGLVAGDDGQLPDRCDGVRFNGNTAGTNVKASAVTPLFTLRIFTGNFGTLSPNGVTGEIDPGMRIIWDVDPAAALSLQSVTIDQTTGAQKVYFIFSTDVQPGSTTLADWLLLASDGVTNLLPGATLSIVNNQVIISLSAGASTGGTVFYNYTGTTLRDVFDNFVSAFYSGTDPAVSGGATPSTGPPGYVSIVVSVSDSDGGPVSLDMTLISGPVALPLADTASQTLSLTADGTYVLAATVTDNVTRTAQIRFNVTIDNVAPLCVVVDFVDARIGDIVSLDGSASTDGNGPQDIITRAWTLVSGPANPPVTQDAAGVATFDSTAFTAGIYTFRHQVTDDNAVSSDALLILRLQGANLIPLADAGLGGRWRLDLGAFTLRGHESADPEGGALTYGWRQTSGPPGALSDPAAASPTFTPPRVGTYTFSLVVTDPAPNTSAAAAVTWVVDDDLNLIFTPRAEAGPLQVISQDDTLNLDGGGSSGSLTDSLTYSWSQTEGPAVSLDAPTARRPSVRLAQAGRYVFSLIVSNDHLPSLPDTVTVYVNEADAPPVADAGPNQTHSTGQWVTLDGTGSFDPNGDNLTYRWTQVAGPAVSFDATAAGPTFPTILSRVYEFDLIVSDGSRSSTADRVAITVNGTNSVPTAIAGNVAGNDVVSVDTSTIIDGTLSSDPDGDSLAIINWVQLSGPPGILDNPTLLNPRFTALVTGDAVFALYVDDGNDRSLADQVTLNVYNVNHDSGDNPLWIRSKPCLVSRINDPDIGRRLWGGVLLALFIVTAAFSRASRRS